MKWRVIVILAIAVTVIFLVLRTCTAPPNQGQRLYASKCASCHMDSGKGLGKAIPPLANADYLMKNREKFACIVRNGQHDTIVVNGVQYDTPMDGFPTLTEIQITNIANYVYSSWGNQAEEFTVREIEEQLKNCD